MSQECITLRTEQIADVDHPRLRDVVIELLPDGGDALRLDHFSLQLSEVRLCRQGESVCRVWNLLRNLHPGITSQLDEGRENSPDWTPAAAGRLPSDLAVTPDASGLALPIETPPLGLEPRT